MSKHKKITRGAKCISIHIAITLLVLLVLVIIYVVHICMVKHEAWDAFRVSRRSEQPSSYEAVDLRLMTTDASSVGVAYIKRPLRLICNTILLKHKWSLAPAHCLTIRSEPELSAMLPHWKIRYKDNGQYKETDIKRSMVHSYYNQDDFDNNIGLFEHIDRINMQEFVFPDKVVSDLLKSTEELAVVGWSNLDKISTTPVRVLSHARCAQFVAPIVNAPRSSELCLFQTRDGSNIEGVHGGALMLNSQIVGFHTWGDRSGKVPQVALVVEPYKAWLEDTMHMNL